MYLRDNERCLPNATRVKSDDVPLTPDMINEVVYITSCPSCSAAARSTCSIHQSQVMAMHSPTCLG
jgi:hypothetical protein